MKPSWPPRREFIRGLDNAIFPLVEIRVAKMNFNLASRRVGGIVSVAIAWFPLCGCSPDTISSPRAAGWSLQREQPPEHSQAATTPANLDWPNLFGPEQNSICRERGLNFQWPEQGPPVVWKNSIGAGYTAPVASEGRMILFHRLGDEEIVESLDAESGLSHWRYAYPTAYQCQFEYSDGPIATPIVEPDRVYTLGAEGEFVCLDGAGRLIWRRSLAREYHVPEALFGVGGSPLLEGDRLILNLGGQNPAAGIIAIDKQSGETLWTATDHAASYSTPVAATIHGRRMVFLLTDFGLVALDPADGRVWWSLPFRSRIPDSPNATSPLVSGDTVLVSMGNGLGSLAARVLPDGSCEELWRDRRVLDSQWNNLIAVDGFVYGYSSARAMGENFRCVELATGRLCWKWRSELRRGASLAVDGHFILWGEYGHLGSMKIDPVAPRLVSMTAKPLLERPCYTVPIVYRGRLYLRNETTLLCLDLRGVSTQP